MKSGREVRERTLFEAAYQLRHHLNDLEGNCTEQNAAILTPACEALEKAVGTIEAEFGGFRDVHACSDDVQRVEAILRGAIAHAKLSGLEITHEVDLGQEHGRWTAERRAGVVEALLVLHQPDVQNDSWVAGFIAASRVLGIAPQAAEAIDSAFGGEPIPPAGLATALRDWHELGVRLGKEFLPPTEDEKAFDRSDAGSGPDPN